MNGELAQAAALVAHGNAWLSRDQAARDAIADFENRNSTFQYVRTVEFQDSSGEAVSRTAEAWLESVTRDGFDKLSLIAGTASAHIPFINQGLWGIVATGANLVEAWYGRWSPKRGGVDPTETKPRIWDVVYRGYRRDGTFQVELGILADRARELRSSLEAAIAFARAKDSLAAWIPSFEQAIALADSDRPQIEYHPDLLPEKGYSPVARRLLAMCTKAWCFGAVGSWNDIGFSDAVQKREYDAVTDRMFSAVVLAIREAVNAFDSETS
jgi:hypothetical protein